MKDSIELPDGSILMHAGHAPYDPRKAHEYYMRHRKLHPKQPGVSYTVTKGNGKTVKLSPQQYAEQSAYAQHRVTQIKANLAKLKTELHKKLAEAKVAQQNAKKPPSAADKAKARRDAKQYRQKHKQELRNKAKQAAAKSGKSSSSSSSPKTATVDSVRAEIIVVRDNLTAAVDKVRELAAAKKNG